MVLCKTAKQKHCCCCMRPPRMTAPGASVGVTLQLYSSPAAVVAARMSWPAAYVDVVWVSRLHMLLHHWNDAMLDAAVTACAARPGLQDCQRQLLISCFELMYRTWCVASMCCIGCVASIACGVLLCWCQGPYRRSKWMDPPAYKNVKWLVNSSSVYGMI